MEEKGVKKNGITLALSSDMRTKIAAMEKADALKKFKLERDPTGFLKIDAESGWRNRLSSRRKIQYTKKRSTVLPESIDLIYAQQLFDPGTKSKGKTGKSKIAEFFAFFLDDGKPLLEGFVWHTTVKNYQKAAHEYGIISVQSMVARVQHALSYSLIRWERACKDGIISNRDAEKMKILEITYQRIQPLFAIERLINNYDYAKTPEANYQAITKLLGDYSKNHKAKPYRLPNIQCLKKFDKHVEDTLRIFIGQNGKAAAAYKKWLAGEWDKLSPADNSDEAKIKSDKAKIKFLRDTVLRPGRADGLASFIRDCLIDICREMKGMNRNLTFGRPLDAPITAYSAIACGALDGLFADALDEIEKYQWDLHNPVHYLHQGLSDKGSDALISVDFTDKHQRGGKSLSQIALAITAIEEVDKIDTGKKEPEIKIGKDGETKKLKRTRFTKWQLSHPRSYIVFYPFIWFINIIISLVLGLVIDLPIGLLGGLVRLRVPSLSHWVTSKINDEFRKKTLKSEQKTTFSKLNKEVKDPHQQSLSNKLGYKLSRFVGDRLIDLFTGIKLVVKFTGITIVKDIWTDGKLGAHSKRQETYFTDDEKETYSFAALCADLKALDKSYQAKMQEEKGKIIEEESKEQASKAKLEDEKKEEITTNDNREFAELPYDLSPFESNDIVSTVIEGGIKFVGVFTHIHKKHEFIGTAFNVAYLFGGLAILAPQALSFLGPAAAPFISASHTIGGLMANGKAFLTISAGFTEAKLVFLFLDLINGRKSLLVELLEKLGDECVNFVLYSGMAVGFGYFLAFEAHIPWLSEHFQEDAGSAPALTFAGVGAKISVSLFELFKVDAENSEAAHRKIEKIKRELKDNLRKAYKRNKEIKDNVELSEEQEKEVSDAFKKLLETVNAKDVKTNYEHYKRDKLLIRLLTYGHLLEALDHHKKRALYAQVRELFADRPDIVASVKRRLFPEPPQSVLATTILMIFSYILLIIRCIFTVLTWNAQPWRDLGEKIVRDLTCLFDSLGKLFYAIFSFLRLMLGCLVDVVVNKIFARLEGAIRGNEHTISTISCQGSAKVDKGLLTASTLAQDKLGLTAAREFCTALSPHQLCNQALTDSDAFDKKAVVPQN